MSIPRPLLPALAVLALSACAHAPEDRLAAPPQTPPAPERVLVTGSHIPVRVDPRTGQPMTASPVQIYSREDLRRTGLPSDVAAALLKLDPSLGI
jgi:hypothetical protein